MSGVDYYAWIPRRSVWHRLCRAPRYFGMRYWLARAHAIRRIALMAALWSTWRFLTA